MLYQKTENENEKKQSAAQTPNQWAKDKLRQSLGLKPRKSEKAIPLDEYRM
jgi:hypothetical protein